MNSKKIIMLLMLAFLLTPQMHSKSIYVAKNGNDLNTGSIDSPFLTIAKGINSMVSGDTVFIRGGTYSLSATISISKIGTSSAKYYIFSYPGERPILDFAAQMTSDGIKVNGTYIHLYGIECMNSTHNGIAVNGSNNIIENCSVHDNKNTGLQLGTGASNNKIINCDSYYNFDSPLGGNADGFAPKLDVGTGNYFYGCRSWQNSDDGWDGYMRPSDNVTTTLESCWSFMNGYLKDGNPISTGNGNGFKMGGGDTSNKDSLRHNMILKNCLSFDNRVKGFDQNNNRGSMTLLNCTGYRNGAENYKISAFIRVSESLTVRNCLELGNKVSLASFAVQQTNSWTIPITVTESDFVSVDTAGVRGPRKADGSLPDVTFMHLAGGSKLINAGTNIGLPYKGIAPDLGAFEFDSPSIVKKNGTTVTDFALYQNFPNPFNSSSMIQFQVQQEGLTTLTVFNVLGQEIVRLFSGVATPATVYTVEFNAHALTSGTYISVLENNGYRKTKKMMLLQ